MLHFRPLPAMTLAMAPVLALLVGLGVWQLRRAEEKREAIAAYEAAAEGRAWSDLVTPLCDIRASTSGQRAQPPSAFVGEPARLYGARGDGDPGWRILRLVEVSDCHGEEGRRLVVVESDFETLRGARLGPPALVVFAAPPRANAFTPQNAPGAGAFYRFDLDELAAAFGVPAASIRGDFWLPASAPGLPAHLARTPPARHVGYAATWFGLAAALVGVYLAYHARADRLAWGRSR